jgi:hypothetical protein
MQNERGLKRWTSWATRREVQQQLVGLPEGNCRAAPVVVYARAIFDGGGGLRTMGEHESTLFQLNELPLFHVCRCTGYMGWAAWARAAADVSAISGKACRACCTNQVLLLRPDANFIS